MANFFLWYIFLSVLYVLDERIKEYVKSRYVLCFTVCFLNTCFGMDRESVRLRQTVFDPEKYEVRISNEYRWFPGCAYHDDAKITINTDQDTHTIRVCSGKSATISTEAKERKEYWKKYWNDMSLSSGQRAEIKTKSEIFYLYAYHKNGEPAYPCSCIKITQIITNNDGSYCTMHQLEFPREMVQSQHWSMPSLSAVLLCGLILYNWGFLEKIRRYF